MSVIPIFSYRRSREILSLVNMPGREERIDALWSSIQIKTEEIIDAERERKGGNVFFHQGRHGFVRSVGPTSCEYYPKANRVGREFFSQFPIYATSAPESVRDEFDFFNASCRGDCVVDLREPQELLPLENQSSFGTAVIYTPPSNPEIVKNSDLIRFRYHWKDCEAISITDLDQLVISVFKIMAERQRFHPETNLWIHCRAGVGRTGTLITAMLLKNELEKLASHERHEAKIVEILNRLILKMREERSSWFVQTYVQFELLYNYGVEMIRDLSQSRTG